MRRRAFVSGALALFAAPLATNAQQAGRIYRLGLLSVTPTPHLMEAWRQGLRDHGWIEGQNLVVEARFSEGVDARFPQLAAELIQLKVDVIVAVSDPAVEAAKQATTSIPIVMAAGTDPIVAGFVSNLARPGGNITGMPIFSDELTAKQLQLLKELVPGISRISVIVPTAFPAGMKMWSVAQAAAPSLGLILRRIDVNVPDDLERAFATMSRQRPDAILVTPTTVVYVHAARLVDFAATNKLPSMYSFRESVLAGGLISYSTALPDLFRHVGIYVDKIFKGAKPGDLPIQQPTKFELVINLKTAKALGLTIPPSLLLRADQVIE
jgi:ABC-type uncharacterized transport system substrate-binding protein